MNTENQANKITADDVEHYRGVDRRSPILSAREYGMATAAQGRTLDAGATRDARVGYAEMESALIDLDLA